MTRNESEWEGWENVLIECPECNAAFRIECDTSELAGGRCDECDTRLDHTIKGR